jgi:hypothetical protein
MGLSNVEESLSDEFAITRRPPPSSYIVPLAWSIVLVLLNKWILESLPYPITLTCAQQAGIWLWSNYRASKLSSSYSSLEGLSEDLHWIGWAQAFCHLLLNITLYQNSILYVAFIFMAVFPIKYLVQYRLDRKIPRLSFWIGFMLLLQGAVLGCIPQIALSPIEGAFAAFTVVTIALCQVGLSPSGTSAALEELIHEPWVVSSGIKFLLVAALWIEFPSMIQYRHPITVQSWALGLACIFSFLAAIRSRNEGHFDVIPLVSNTSKNGVPRFAMIYLATMLYEWKISEEYLTLWPILGAAICPLGWWVLHKSIKHSQLHLELLYDCVFLILIVLNHSMLLLSLRCWQKFACFA